MNIGSISSAALAGVHRGFQTIDGAAQKIASSSVQPESQNKPTDFTRPLVELKEGKQQVQAASKVLQAENERIGSLLDLRA